MTNRDINKINEQVDFDDEEIKQEKKIGAKRDLIFAIILFLISVYVIIMGASMPVEQLVGSKDRWYVAPGSFPIYVGVILLILSVILFSISIKKGAKIEKFDFSSIKGIVKSSYFIRMLLAIVLLAIYVFIILGNVYYPFATFIYLFVTMVVFRRKGYKIWKLVVISAASSVIISFAFSELANIPLP